MKGIGGNAQAVLQARTVTRNALGEQVAVYKDVQTLWGWLDLAGGTSTYTDYAAKVQESTHVFVADYVPLDDRITAETAVAMIGGERYDIMLIDNPMGMGSGSQLEIYLKYTGGQGHGRQIP